MLARLLQQVVVLAPLLVDVGGNDGLGDVRRVRAPVAVLLQNHDRQFGIAPRHHAHEPGVRGSGAALDVGIAAAHHLGRAGLAGEVDAFNVRGRRGARGGRRRHALRDRHPGVGIQRNNLSPEPGNESSTAWWNSAGSSLGATTCGRTKWPSDAMPDSARKS